MFSQTTGLLTSSETFAPVFWCHVEYDKVLYYFRAKMKNSATFGFKYDDTSVLSGDSDEEESDSDLSDIGKVLYCILFFFKQSTFEILANENWLIFELQKH